VTKADRRGGATFPVRQSHDARYRQVKGTKRGERSGRKSERLGSTEETGEPRPLEESAEGSEASGIELLLGNIPNAWKFE
jgi:hypothetical protein